MGNLRNRYFASWGVVEPGKIPFHLGLAVLVLPQPMALAGIDDPDLALRTLWSPGSPDGAVAHHVHHQEALVSAGHVDGRNALAQAAAVGVDKARAA